MEIMANTRHLGEAGAHFMHTLEQLENGWIYCCTCEKRISWKTADLAWPENTDKPDLPPEIKQACN
jgi:hypothetical protein